MNISTLITMLNQMGTFFVSQPDQKKAEHDLAEHVRLFWEPRMRSAIFEFLAQHPDGKSTEAQVKLMPIALSALKHHQERLQPQPDVKSPLY